MAKGQKKKRVKLLVGIINSSDAEAFAEAVGAECVSLNFSGMALGTASSNYLSYFGINEVEKKTVFSLIPDYKEHATLLSVAHALKLYLLGRGIAFTLPLSSVSDVIEGVVLQSPERADSEGAKKRRVSKKEKSTMHELVVAVVDQKYTEVAIEAARAAGATGATVFHTRSVGNEAFEQKLGTSFSSETDTVFFLTSFEYRTRIMEAVRDAAGLKTEGGAVIFSLPVDDLVGIGRFEENEE